MTGKRIVVKLSLSQLMSPTTYSRNCGHKCDHKSRITMCFFLTEGHMKIPKMTSLSAASPRIGSPTPRLWPVQNWAVQLAGKYTCLQLHLRKWQVLTVMCACHSRRTTTSPRVTSRKVWGLLS